VSYSNQWIILSIRVCSDVEGLCLAFRYGIVTFSSANNQLHVYDYLKDYQGLSKMKWPDCQCQIVPLSVTVKLSTRVTHSTFLTLYVRLGNLILLNVIEIMLTHLTNDHSHATNAESLDSRRISRQQEFWENNYLTSWMFRECLVKYKSKDKDTYIKRIVHSSAEL